jgi:hypothetical protein
MNYSKNEYRNEGNIVENAKQKTTFENIKEIQMNKDDDLTKKLNENDGDILANAKPETEKVEIVYTFGEGYNPEYIPKEEERIKNEEEYLEELVNGIYREYEISRKVRRDFNSSTFQQKYKEDLETLFFATHALFTGKRILREYKKYLANKENENKDCEGK